MSFTVAFAQEREGSLSDIVGSVAPFHYDPKCLYQPDNRLNRTTATDGSATTSNYMLDRHQKLIAEGWELKEIMIEDIVVPLSERMTSRSSNGIVITGYRVAKPVYTQPIRTKTSYNSALLDGVSNLSSTLTTVISSAVPVCKWVPKTVGFLTKKIVDLSARKKSTFTEPSTLRYYDIEVKIEGHGPYFEMASSQRYEASIAATFAGYKEDGTPFTETAKGDGAKQSAHYANYNYLKEKAREATLRDDGVSYAEKYGTKPKITIK